MFEALAERLLNSILGEYLESFSKENLKIGVWSGEVVLRNVALKRTIVRKLNLPLRIAYSRIGCLRMNVPWKSLASSKIEVLLEGLELVVAEVPVAEWECKDTQIVEKRKKQLESFCEGVLGEFAKKGEKEKEEGYFSRLVVKIIDNLQVTIRDIHLRYEDHLTKAYSFGLTLEEFKLYTVNADGQPQYIDRSKPEFAGEPLRKRLELYNIGIYWNEKSQFYTEENCPAKMGSSIARRGQPPLHNYLILMSSQAQLLQRESGKQFLEPEIDLKIELKTLRLEISNTQLQQIITLGERLQRYTRRVAEENRQKLSPKEVKANIDYFTRIFPDYYNGYGSNLPKADAERLEQILEKMEVENFTKAMTQYLQEREKERIIKEKQEKKKSWWLGKPKQLTKEELKEIEAYLNDNFAQDTPIVKRPEDYHYVRIAFTLERLEVVIANRLAIIKEGIEASFEDLKIGVRLREGGYSLEITLEDIGVGLFKQVGVDSRENKQVLSKLSQGSSNLDNAYLRMLVVGNPLDKKYLNTDIKLATSQLLIVFDPKIISIATEFADLNLSQENKEAALEKFGEIKEKTEAAVTEQIDKPVKAQIGVDVVFNSVTIVLPFSPHRPALDCWALNLGVTRLTTDEETLRRVSASEDQPLDTFNLQLTDFSLRHFGSAGEVKKLGKQTGVTHSVIDNLSFRLRVDVFNKASDSHPKIKVLAVLPSLSVNLTSFTYGSLLRVGEAFEQEQRVHQSRVTARMDEKKEIQQRASKIGFVCVKDSLTLVWKKYVAIMSENYIYLYLSKNDKEYYAFYYVKGATLDKYTEPTDKEKPYHFRIKNKVNEVVFGFDKEEQIDDWITKIRATSKEQEFVSQVVSATALSALSGLLNIPPKKEHDKFNLMVQAEIESIGVKVYTTESLLDKVVKLYFTKLTTSICLHESKKRITLGLGSLQLLDTLYLYKSKQLVYFLQTQRSKEEEQLISLEILQLNRDHPLYDHTDSAITVTFGTLRCNYKCETVKLLLSFFLPPPAQDSPPSPNVESEVLASTSFSVPITEEIFSLKLKLSINEISVTLVNEKAKTVVGRMGITRLELFMGISQRRTLLVGSLKDLFLTDSTHYPRTVYLQQEDYGERTLLTANIGEDKNMMDFNIELLNEPNEYGKKMLIDIAIANLTTYYIQQPILRLITYLNTQLLPSFQTGPKPPPLPSDAKPEPTPMQLRVELTNISVFVETEYQAHKEKQEFLQLNVGRVSVKNDSMYRPYVKQSKPIVLVENYEVRLGGMTLAVHYFDGGGREHRYKLTNSLDLTVSTDLIANPLFYKKEIPEMFLDGLRVECSMTAFFMRLNHDDYSFIMKCLNWAITHDDGLDPLLFDPPPQAQPESKQSKDPFYLAVSMECISLFVTQNDIPIAFLLLDQMPFHLSMGEQGMQMDLRMNNLYGTSIEYSPEEKTLTERGVFNSLGYSSQKKLEKALDLEGFIALFDRRDKVSALPKPPFLNCIITLSDSSTDIQLQLHELDIEVDLRLLMVLSTLANTDPRYIQGPPPIRQAEGKAEGGSGGPKKFTMLVEVKRVLGSVSDGKKEKLAMIEGGVSVTMLNYGDKSMEEIEECLRRKPVNDGINHSTLEAVLRDFTIYFSKIKEGQLLAKRELLRPMRIDLALQKFYTKHRDIYILCTDIRLKTDALLLAASLKDMLNLNKIAQDNLQVLQEHRGEQQPEGQSGIKEEQLKSEIQRLEESMGKEIQSKTKIVGTIGPMHIEVINDCDSNFMPVLRLLLEDTSPALHQTVLATEVFVVPILSLYFFNPRSSRWEPILEPFKAAVSYKAITVNQQRSTTLTLTANTPEPTSSLKLNLSTQMISTLMATRELLRAEQERMERSGEGKEIEVSPFIFHNLTNERVQLLRGDNEFQLDPLFRGPVRLPSDSHVLFRMRNATHKFSLDHYGVLRIPNCDYFIRFATEKLNRVVKFMPLLALKNKLQQPIYVRRFGRVPEVPSKVEKNEVLPLDGVDSFAVSLNGSSYTERVRSEAVKLKGCLLAEKKNFVVLLRCREKINRYTVVQLLPPFLIHNCLPKELHLQFIQKAKTKSTVAIKAQHSYSVFTSEDIATLELKAYANGYTWSARFRYSEKEGESQLRLEDEDNFATILNYLFKRDKATGQFTLILYCKQVIVNEMKDKLLVYANFQADEHSKKTERYELLGGQKRDDDSFDEKVIMVGEEVGSRLRVCGAHSVFDFATPISTAGLGLSQSRIVVDRPGEGRAQSLFMTIGVEISAAKMAKDCDIFCKKIVLRSRVIILNETALDLTLAEDAATKHRFLSEAGTRKNYVSGLPEIPGQHYRYTVTSKGYLPSKPIHLPLQGSVFFKLRSSDRLDKSGRRVEAYFKIYVHEVEGYNFYQITQIAPEELPYEVRVGSQRLRASIPALNLTASKGAVGRFLNESVEEGRFEVELLVEHLDSKEEVRVRVCPDDLQFRQKELVRVEKGGMLGSVAVVVEVTISDKQRTILVRELGREEEEQEVQQSAIMVELREIVLSVNQNSESVEVPYESFVVTLQRLCFIKLETDKKQQYQLKLGFLQVDQGYPFLISSPVILTPHKYELFTREKDPKSIFNFTIVFSKEFVSNTFIREVAVDFEDIVATFSADFITLAIAIATEFAEVVNYREETYLLERREERWQEVAVAGEGNSVFIRAIRISPFLVDLSAELNIKKLNLQNNLLLTTILSTFGIVMSNIDNAPFELAGIEINDCIDTVPSITAKLLQHYKRTCISQLYKAFGSLNILGNPLNLFRNISTGVRDLKEKPAQGFVNGPAEFGLGIVEGTGSFVAHSVGGAFNSISKVTGTVSSGLATLAFDKEFEEHREKERMKKPQNVIQGLEKGGKAIFYGFKEGITGVWMQPIENARREGALGFVKGAAKGLAGLVIKPVTGIIDFASKTTEGIKNNALIFEDKARESRMRYPRVFYSECFILKEYSPRDSELYSVLKKVDNEERFQAAVFVDAFEAASGHEYLVVLQAGIAYLDLAARKLRWAVDYPDLELQDNAERRVLQFKKRGKAANFFNVDYEVPIEEGEARAAVAELILTLQKERLQL